MACFVKHVNLKLLQGERTITVRGFMLWKIHNCWFTATVANGWNERRNAPTAEVKFFYLFIYFSILSVQFVLIFICIIHGIVCYVAFKWATLGEMFPFERIHAFHAQISCCAVRRCGHRQNGLSLSIHDIRIHAHVRRKLRWVFKEFHVHFRFVCFVLQCGFDVLWPFPRKCILLFLETKCSSKALQKPIPMKCDHWNGQRSIAIQINNEAFPSQRYGSIYINWNGKSCKISDLAIPLVSGASHKRCSLFVCHRNQIPLVASVENMMKVINYAKNHMSESVDCRITY